MRLVLALLVVASAAAGSLPGSGRAQGTPAPYQASAYAELFQGALEDIDRYWRLQFAGSGFAYRTPTVRWREIPEPNACGAFDPQSGPGAYCPLDESIVLSVPWYDQLMADGVDFAWVTVAAHEWGHHVQFLVGIRPGPGSAFELQADCLAGAYAQDAAGSGLLESGDITEAVAMSSSSGDPVWLPNDHHGAHGSGDERLTSFMRGYINGVADCSVIFAGESQDSPKATSTLPTDTIVTDPTPPTGTLSRGAAEPLTERIPATLALSQGQPFRLESEGASSFADMVADLPRPEETRRLLPTWGWEENFYRVFASDDPPPGAAGWVAIGVHRFASPDGAAKALSYFAAARRGSLGYRSVDIGLFADQTEALTGRAVNGDELIVYARRGNLVFRASGIAPNGDPTPDVFEALLLCLTPLADDPSMVSPALFAALPDATDAPEGLAPTEEHARSAATIATTFPDVAEAERRFQEWGWRESAARVFTGTAPSGGNRLETSVFRFADDASAEQALPYFLGARAEVLGLEETVSPPARADQARAIEGETVVGIEATAYLRRGRDLFRVTVIGGADPMADLAILLATW